MKSEENGGIIARGVFSSTIKDPSGKVVGTYIDQVVPITENTKAITLSIQKDEEGRIIDIQLRGE